MEWNVWRWLGNAYVHYCQKGAKNRQPLKKELTSNWNGNFLCGYDKYFEKLLNRMRVFVAFVHPSCGVKWAMVNGTLSSIKSLMRLFLTRGYFSAVNLTIVSDFLCRKWRLIRNVGIFPPLDYAKDKAHFDVAKAHRLNELSKQIQVYTNQNF